MSLISDLAGVLTTPITTELAAAIGCANDATDVATALVNAATLGSPAMPSLNALAAAMSCAADPATVAATLTARAKSAYNATNGAVPAGFYAAVAGLANYIGTIARVNPLLLTLATTAIADYAAVLAAP